jgi:hypothetical protein
MVNLPRKRGKQKSPVAINRKIKKYSVQGLGKTAFYKGGGTKKNWLMKNALQRGRRKKMRWVRLPIKIGEGQRICRLKMPYKGKGETKWVGKTAYKKDKK